MPHSVREVIDAVGRVTGRTVPWTLAPRRPGDPAALYARADKARVELGWAPRFSDLDAIVGTAWALAPVASARVFRLMTRQPAAPLVDPLLSVVMPAYNERDTIDEIIRRVLAVPVRLELIVVDDCSTDGTRDQLQALQRELGFTLILQPANGGKGAALRTGFAKVSGEIVIIQDADLEYSPEEYPSLIELICTGRADVVYGSRFLGRHRVFLFTHYAGNRVLTLLTNILYNTMLTDMETCFKVDARRGAAVDDAQVEPLRHRAGADGEDLQARLPRVRNPDHLRRSRVQ